ncbi:MAG: glycerol-3-phosphate 1-O-acyltransferase PlsY [Candidatus Marinimicrobia bacterium]|jgi:glycerol-3-phosphate acyltransferase PlsY|nr:glycerol-3-phosphate 1-O-acyltransferase PlsY [Candidatus Neomarinimicrobiota bacterium]MBT3634990.1 glycerol-3-phosphate 1-O-acyltransferase PlsY [Candidatus Neomarinimicrobiota bacterium]MBT3683821.1 glycerol-3-phosphate 1-O-acyltransferase PlsY [Candidatus Neomarinimicrobiota bacterium]MBT3760642.1 glycerol-3-phosphate 1-O-acyltransferase PlsY [Candidatus Neomarinimicrobiota bacterium]MBT3896831.1 glycerol-3-phosphate 1-O-acyltransferase PlsY [Candidatus Neomarinimicrobiota bacterium]
MDYNYLISAITGYLFGCFQASYFVGILVNKIDIREHGSTNAGASNVTMVMGFKWGVVVAVLDILKGSAAVWLSQFLFPGQIEFAFIAGICAILGHIYPFFMKFQGGKGIATLIGMFLALNWQLGLIILGIQVVISLATDYVAAGSLVLYVALPVMVYYFDFSQLCILLSLLMMVIGIYKHIPNARRIKNGTEPKIRATLSKKKSKAD